MTVENRFDEINYAMKALEGRPRDARHDRDHADAKDDTRKRWHSIPHDEQVAIIDSWLYTQSDHRTLISEWMSQHESHVTYDEMLRYMACVMVLRNSHRGWVL